MLGAVLLLLTSLHSLLLWLGNRGERGLGPLLAAGALQGAGLLASAGPAGSERFSGVIDLALLGSAGYGLWALRRYAGLPARMQRWAWLALGSWVLVGLAFQAMGLFGLGGLAVPVALAVLALAMAREWARLPRTGAAPAQLCAGLALALGLAALGAGLTASYFPAQAAAPEAQVHAWFWFGILAAQQLATLLLGQVQGQRLRARLEGLVATDPLTGLASAQGFRARLDRAVGRSLRTGVPTSLLILELDDLGPLAAEHGPLLLGRILEAFARTLDQTLREADFSGRLEGGRFVALLHRTQPLEALLAAERLRATWEDQPLTLGARAFRSTLSAGMASTREPVADSEALLAMALGRAALARTVGGNTVEGEPLLE